MMDFLFHQWRIRRTRKSIVRIIQQAAREFRYGMLHSVTQRGAELAQPRASLCSKLRGLVALGG
ncbi:hypothetical protein Rcae01_01019 [Novipirellula caenicola]|uniref:Uncharacterized protein n=1 Tax=Novipirellula caenicola TaxID=1536901 RepID=A0ABP9VK44_9BACT